MQILASGQKRRIYLLSAPRTTGVCSPSYVYTATAADHDLCTLISSCASQVPTEISVGRIHLNTYLAKTHSHFRVTKCIRLQPEITE